MTSLHLVTDDKYINQFNFLEKLIPTFDAGIDFFQLRFKQLDKKYFFEIGRVLKPILKERQITFIINDHIDIALALDADGVHIGQSDLPYRETRKLIGNKKCLGVSISSLDELQRAIDYNCDYYGVGPIFSTRTKNNAAPTLSFEELNKITAQSKKPCIAIGGVQASNIEFCIQQGVSGIAVCEAICNADSPLDATQQIKACYA